MSSHHVQASVGLPYDRVVAVLTSRPAGWLRGFLNLAVAPAFDAHTDTVPHWYRLGQRTTRAGSATTMSLIWWPHTRAVFERFGGDLVIEPGGRNGQGTSLALTGTTRGGDAPRDQAVLERLVTALAQALSADQADG